MDELYRLVSGQTIKHTISDMARREADNRRLALEVEDPEAFYYEYQPEFSDPRTIYTPEELEENPEPLSTTAATGLSFRWHWAGKAVQAVIAGALALALSR